LILGQKVKAAGEGKITGTVKIDGAAPHMKGIDMSKDPYCSKAHASDPAHLETYVTGANGGLENLRLVMCMTLAWAEKNSYIQRPTGWLSAIRLPKKTGGRKVVRTELEPEQTLAIIAQLKEPYATLVLFLASVGRRIEEAAGLQPGDLDSDNILHIRRIIYDGHVEMLETEQVLPLDAPDHEAAPSGVGRRA
jgi:hypothetical protein